MHATDDEIGRDLGFPGFLEMGLAYRDKRNKMSLPSQEPLSTAEVHALRQLFLRTDTDGDGKIDLHDLKEAFKQCGLALTDRDTKDLLMTINSTTSRGVFTWEEVLALVSKRPFKKKIEDELRLVFEAYDEDQTGYVDLNIVRLLLAETGDAEQLKDGQVDLIIEQLNRNAPDGKISFENFATVYMQHFC